MPKYLNSDVSSLKAFHALVQFRDQARRLAVGFLRLDDLRQLPSPLQT